MCRGTRRLLLRLLAISFVPVAVGCSGSDGGDYGRWRTPEGTPDATKRAPDAGPLEPDAGPFALDVVRFAPDVDPLVPDAGPLAPDVIPLAADADLTAEAGTVPPDAEGAPDGVDQGDLPPIPATVIVLPDTQYYSASFPNVFAAQTRWIVEQAAPRHIAAALHLGDLVDSSNDRHQWTVANSSMRALDGLVPFVVVPGNHDTDGNRQGLIDDFFAPQSMPWIAGTMAPGQIENSYALIDIGPQQWLVLGLEFGPRDAVLAWADGVLKANPTRPAIIVTHAYLYQDGSRYDIAISGLDNTQPGFQYFIPQWYGYTANQGINDGEMIWQKLILPNPKVRLVFCGHDFGAARLTSRRPDGSAVHQMLSDYQWLYSGTADDLGGSGYLRILEFDYRKKEIRVQTYSPYLNLFMADDANQFSVSLEL